MAGLDRRAHKEIVAEAREKSVQQEIDSADLYGAKRIAGSGAGREKGDINLPGWKLELKRTDKESISIKRAWLIKIWKEATAARKRPALEFQMGNETWVAVKRHDFLYLLSLEEKEQNGN